MTDFTVARDGTDGVGRAIWLTAYMHDWFEALVKACQQHAGFTPVIVQGAFMVRDGGGAAASAGYHDAGGCIDLNVLGLTTHQWQYLVRQCRRTGAAAWKRDRSWVHGAMAPHVHVTLGSDRPLSVGAKASWAEYLAGGDGLMGDRPDYHWRPDPLVTTWPPAHKPATQEDDMPLSKHDLDQIDQIVDKRLRKYLGDIVPAHKGADGSGGPTKVWVGTALGRLLERTRPGK